MYSMSIVSHLALTQEEWTADNIFKAGVGEHDYSSQFIFHHNWKLLYGM